MHNTTTCQVIVCYIHLSYWFCDQSTRLCWFRGDVLTRCIKTFNSARRIGFDRNLSNTKHSNSYQTVSSAHSVRKQLIPMVTSTINRQRNTSYIFRFGYVTTAAWKCPPCKKDAKIIPRNCKIPKKIARYVSSQQNITMSNLMPLNFGAFLWTKQFSLMKHLRRRRWKESWIIYIHICSLIELSTGEAKRIMISG